MELVVTLLNEMKTKTGGYLGNGCLAISPGDDPDVAVGLGEATLYQGKI